MYGRIVLGLDGEVFEHELEKAKTNANVQNDAEIPAEVLKQLCQVYKSAIAQQTGKPFPQDPAKQLRGAVEAVFRSWNGPRAIAYRVREKISHELGTAVNVQAMVFGNRDDNSGTGVGFTRNAATGDAKPYGDFLVNAQGEDVVAGIRNTEDLNARPKVGTSPSKVEIGIYDLSRDTVYFVQTSDLSYDQLPLILLGRTHVLL